MWNAREFLQYNKGELIRSDRRGADGFCQKAVLECKTSQDGIGQEHYALASGVHFCTLKPEFIYSLERKNGWMIQMLLWPRPSLMPIMTLSLGCKARTINFTKERHPLRFIQVMRILSQSGMNRATHAQDWIDYKHSLFFLLPFPIIDTFVLVAYFNYNWGSFNFGKKKLY